MSAENVELVRRLQPSPEVDLAAWFRDERTVDRLRKAFGHLFQPDCEVEAPAGSDRLTAIGIEGLRAGWLEWTAPWVTYRAEVEELIDLGDRVVVLVRDFGRIEAGGAEISTNAASIWTIRCGKVARVEFYPDRAEGLEAAGLSS